MPWRTSAALVLTCTSPLGFCALLEEVEFKRQDQAHAVQVDLHSIKEVEPTPKDDNDDAANDLDEDDDALEDADDAVDSSKPAAGSISSVKALEKVVKKIAEDLDDDETDADDEETEDVHKAKKSKRKKSKAKKSKAKAKKVSKKIVKVDEGEEKDDVDAKSDKSATSQGDMAIKAALVSSIKEEAGVGSKLDSAAVVSTIKEAGKGSALEDTSKTTGKTADHKKSCCFDSWLFRDAKGFPCSSWVGYACNDVGVYPGYNMLQMHQIRSLCPKTCMVCSDGWVDTPYGALPWVNDGSANQYKEPKEPEIPCSTMGPKPWGKMLHMMETLMGNSENEHHEKNAHSAVGKEEIRVNDDEEEAESTDVDDRIHAEAKKLASVQSKLSALGKREEFSTRRVSADEDSSHKDDNDDKDPTPDAGHNSAVANDDDHEVSARNNYHDDHNSDHDDSDAASDDSA